MYHIQDKIILIYITYICQTKNTSFFVDYLDHSAIIFSKNDDYLKLKDRNIMNITFGMSDIIMDRKIERIGNFEIK